MTEQLTNSTGSNGVFSAVTAWTRGHRKISLAIAAVLTLFSVIVAPMIPYISDPTEYFPADDPEVSFWLDMTRRFGGLDILMVGLEEQEDVLSFDGLVALTKISDLLNEKKAAGILSARSLTNVSTMSQGEDETINASYLIPSLPRNQEAKDELEQIIRDDTQVKGALVSSDLMGYILVIQTDPRKDLRVIAELVQEIVEGNKGTLNAYYYGAPFVASQITNGVYKKLVWLVPLFVCFLLLVLFVVIRRPIVIAAVLVCSGATLIWWLGMLYLAGVPLSPTTANGALLILSMAAVIFARGAEGWIRQIHFPFPARSLYFLLIAAIALYVLSFASLPFLANFGVSASLGALAVALFGPLAFGPLMSLIKPDAAIDNGECSKMPINKKLGLALALISIVLGLVATSNMRFYINLSELFSEENEVGQSIAFFNRRFGGSEFMQVHLKADLKDPAVLARVGAIADLLEGEKEFPDVRAISQVVTFLSKNFSGIHRIPDSRDGLKNLLFFLEGSEDIRPMVSKSWDEAMITVRVPGGPYKAEEWTKLVQKALDNSKLEINELTKHRLQALANRYDVKGFTFDKAEKIIALADFKDSATNRTVLESQIGKLKEYMFSGDSPFEPSDGDWSTLSEVLQTSDGDLDKNLTSTIIALENYKKLEYPDEVAAELADMLKVRRNHLLLEARSALLTKKMLVSMDQQDIPDVFRTKAQGIFADLVAKREFAKDEMKFTISGLPAIIGKVETQLIEGTWHGALILWFVLAILVAIVVRDVPVALRAALEALVATLLTFFFGWTLGVQVDSASANLYLLPPLITYFLSPWLSAAARYGKPKLAKFSKTFAISLAAGCLTLTMTGVLPVVRLGAVIAICMIVSVIVVSVSQRIPVKNA